MNIKKLFIVIVSVVVFNARAEQGLFDAIGNKIVQVGKSNPEKLGRLATFAGVPFVFAAGATVGYVYDVIKAVCVAAKNKVVGQSATSSAEQEQSSLGSMIGCGSIATVAYVCWLLSSNPNDFQTFNSQS